MCTNQLLFYCNFNLNKSVYREIPSGICNFSDRNSSFFFKNLKQKFKFSILKMSLSGRDDNGQGHPLSPLIFDGS